MARKCTCCRMAKSLNCFAASAGFHLPCCARTPDASSTTPQNWKNSGFRRSRSRTSIPYKPGMTAVLYKPLPGETLRQITHKPGFSWTQTLPALIELIRSLHLSGIYFRSLHLGNIVVTPDDKLGLIDVADMRFLRAPLSERLKRRNLQHFAGYIKRENLDQEFPMQALEQALLAR